MPSMDHVVVTRLISLARCYNVQHLADNIVNKQLYIVCVRALYGKKSQRLFLSKGSCTAQIEWTQGYDTR